MAGPAGGKPCVKCYLVLATIVLVVLAATGVWNPFPALWEWINQSQPLSSPAVAWQQRLGATPKSVTIVGDAVIVEHRTSVESRGLTGGVRLWEHDADWAAVAGEGTGAVVVTGELLVKGYDVVDPTSGKVRRHDTAAVAVWTFRNGMLDVRCAGAQDCTLTAWEPRGAEPLWRVQLPGVGFVLFADNPEVLGTRPLKAPRVNTDAGGPLRMPQVIGFPIDGKVYVVDTTAGKLLRELRPDREDRVVVVGGRILRVSSDARDGSCYFTVEATDAATGQQVWRQTGLNLRTAEGSGCAQRHDPNGQENVIVAVAADGREGLLDAYDGRGLWFGANGETAAATDSRHALLRSADQRIVYGLVLGNRKPTWSRKVGRDAQAALARHAAVLVERDPDRVIALDPRTGAELLNLRSSAKVAAAGPGGLILVDRREIGYAPYGGRAAPNGADGTAGGTGGGTGGGTAGGTGGGTAGGTGGGTAGGTGGGTAGGTGGGTAPGAPSGALGEGPRLAREKCDGPKREQCPAGGDG